ncbi:unnamed protein product [Cladocopium goreaui]|uniref:Uncharacterized protein n=1 Tax=Cladocopium goreaui TaxID=2562237 RepID=A0A9P1GH10_9DINO|nr:unnamed protein product [Cladocopium goreaui]
MWEDDRFSSVRRWCICGNRALLLGNALLLCSLYIVHFHKELGRREALEAAVEELHQALASSSDALQDARNQVVALTEMATRHQGGLQACEKRGKELVQQLEASLHTEEVRWRISRRNSKVAQRSWTWRCRPSTRRESSRARRLKQ